MTKRKVVQSDLIDLLLADYRKPEDLIGENAILKQLTKAIVERALQSDLAIHLGHDKHEAAANEHGNTPNGSNFELQLIAKHQTRWSGIDAKILSLYARGMTVQEIQSHLEEMYGTEVTPTLITSVTDAVMDEVKAWQAGPLDALYPMSILTASMPRCATA